VNIINVAPFDELVSLINSLSDENSKRILLSKAADVYGNGGKAHIVKLTGITYPTLIAGKSDSESDDAISGNRIRREGAGRKPTTETYPDITEIIEKIIDGNTYGNPSKELHWAASTLSLRKISDIFEEDYSITISYVKISQLLTDMGYSKQANQKMEQAGMQARTVRNGLNSLAILPISIWRMENRLSPLIQRKKRTLAISKMAVRSIGK